MSAHFNEATILRIRELNDDFRSTFVGGSVNITPGVEILDPDTRRAVLEKVRAFSAFDHTSDPFEEHDFGELSVAGTRFFWKIDYFDRRCRLGSPDPTDPEVTTRVLTVLRADEH